MHGLTREIESHATMQRLALHLYTRVPCGQAVIVADRPLILLSQLRKEWLRLIRKIHTQRASTLDATRILELTNSITYMRNLHFTVDYPPDDFPAHVYIATVNQLLRWAPECRTLYITNEIATEQIHMITAWMPRGGLVVICPMNRRKESSACAHN